MRAAVKNFVDAKSGGYFEHTADENAAGVFAQSNGNLFTM